MLMRTIFFMAGAQRKGQETLFATVSVVAAAFVLTFNLTKPMLGEFSQSVDVDINQVHDHGHAVANELNGFHKDHPAHKHKHTHHDGTTHEHDYHDDHCIKISSNMIWCLPAHNTQPLAVYFLSADYFAMKDPICGIHFRELLRPPILA